LPAEHIGRQVPSTLPHTTSVDIPWWGNPHRQAPRVTTTPWNCVYRLAGQTLPLAPHKYLRNISLKIEKPFITFFNHCILT